MSSTGYCTLQCIACQAALYQVKKLVVPCNPADTPTARQPPSILHQARLPAHVSIERMIRLTPQVRLCQDVSIVVWVYSTMSRRPLKDYCATVSKPSRTHQQDALKKRLTMVTAQMPGRPGVPGRLDALHDSCAIADDQQPRRTLALSLTLCRVHASTYRCHLCISNRGALWKSTPLTTWLASVCYSPPHSPRSLSFHSSISAR